ncbi:MAG TPA: hypothetical protein ENF47_05650 [Thermoprotei archaeon]|nr:hypothetical protein [Thermoprotei archaeon]
MHYNHLGGLKRLAMDRDIIEAFNGEIYIVISSSHPRDRVISYLKYIPSKEKGSSIWFKDGIWYHRILKHYGAKYLSKIIKEYKIDDFLVYDDYLGITLIEIPTNQVKVHYLPEERTKEIIREPKDKLEMTAREIILSLSEKTGVPIDNIGITGSILLKMHNLRYSDIDLLVYGYNNAFKIRRHLLKLLEEGEFFKRLHGWLLEKYVEELTKTYPLDRFEALRICEETWSRGVFRNRFFSIHPVLYPSENIIKYGDQRYKGICLLKIKARVVDDRYSMFMPAIYRVSNVKLLSGCKFTEVNKISEVVSYEAIYSDIAGVGEDILVYGKLEKVEDLNTGNIHYRVLVGSYEANGMDYIKPLRWYSEENI